MTEMTVEALAKAMHKDIGEPGSVCKQCITFSWGNICRFSGSHCEVFMLRTHCVNFIVKLLGCLGFATYTKGLPFCS